MSTEITVYVMVLLFATVMAFNLAAYSLLRKTVPAARPFGLIALSIGLWSFFYMFEVINRQLDNKLVFFSLKYIGVAILPIAFLIFVLAYTGKDMHTYRRILPVFTIQPIATLLVLWTNPLHHWFLIFPHMQVQYTFFVLAYQPGFWFYLNTIYSLVMVLVCCGILLQHYGKVGLFRKRQMRILFVSIAIPMVPALLMLTGFRLVPRLDFVLMAFAISLPMLSLAVFRYRLLDIVPEARDLVIESMEDCVVVINRNHHILDANPAAQRLLRISLEEGVGLPLAQFLPEWERVVAMLDVETRFHTELNLTQNDHTSWYELHTWPLKTWRGSRAGRLVLLHDITSARELQDSLRQAKEAAETADQAKSVFLANMSHELRTPLNAVIGMSSLLMEMPLTSEQKTYVETIQTSSKSLLTIINDILDYSKIEAGRMRLENLPFNLQSCMEEALEMVTPQAYAKKIEINIHIQENTPLWVSGDVTRLRQVMLNLLSNAVKFTEQGEVWLRAEKLNAGPDEIELAFSVQDTGIGIPQEKINQLFDMFSQVDAGITRRFGGTGLGLAISRRLVELMGGRIWVESQEGKGSVFHFSIKVQPYFGEETPSNEQDAQVFAGKRILIAVGSPSNLTALQQLAKRWGMQAVATSRGAEVMSILKRDRRFDVILLGVQISDFTPAQLAQRIRAIPEGAGIPLILLTTFGTRLDDLDRTQFAAVLTKPVKPSQLESVLKVLFQPQDSEGVFPPNLSGAILDARFARLHPLRIVIAEDNPVNQVVVQRFLERLGYRADSVANGIELLQALQRKDYDLVFMDIQMPEMDGLEATRRIRAQFSPERQPRIIGLTAYAFPADVKTCFAAGMDDYLSKPISFEAFLQVLNRHIPPKEVSADRLNGLAQPSVPVGNILNQLGDAREEVVQLFLTETQRNLAALEAAFQQGDVILMQEAVHKFKTGCGYLGATELFRLCLQVENEVRQGRFIDEQTIVDLKTLYARLAEEYHSPAV